MPRPCSSWPPSSSVRGMVSPDPASAESVRRQGQGASGRSLAGIAYWSTGALLCLVVTLVWIAGYTSFAPLYRSSNGLVCATTCQGMIVIRRLPPQTSPRNWRGDVEREQSDAQMLYDLRRVAPFLGARIGLCKQWYWHGLFGISGATWTVMPLWLLCALPCVLLVIPVSRRIWRRVCRTRRRRGGRCVACGYSLKGLQSARCPECGSQYR